MLRHYAKALLRKVGFEIVRSEHIPRCSLGMMHLACLALYSRAGPLTLVQIGANDGVLNDPAREVIAQVAARAVLVEPVPEAFRTLSAAYAGIGGVTLENAAIGRQDGEFPFYVPMKGAAKQNTQIASLSRRHLIKHGVKPEYIETITVPVLSLRSLLTKHRIEKLDAIQVDAEGLDWEIVSTAMDTNIRPPVLHFENVNLDRSAKFESRRRLAAEGYRLFETATDTLAVCERVFE